MVSGSKLRVAIVHYWFLVYGGGERVIEALGDMFPHADIFALFADEGSTPETIRHRKLRTSFLDRIPGARKVSRELFPFYPLAVESLDLRDYDLVISSDSPPMKGILTHNRQLHICYCHTPGRYLWDSFEDFRSTLPWLFRPGFSTVAAYLRRWDYQAAQRVNHFVANSRYVADRIRRYYQRDSTVIYPPVNTDYGYISTSVSDAYLHVGRLVEGKRIDLLIQACNQLGRKLLIAGTGREEQKLKAMAGPTIEFLGRVPDSQLSDLYATSRALLFAADEDFGIVPLEAQAHGRPVIAYAKGGSLETVRGNSSDGQQTGVFFHQQTVESLAQGIRQFEEDEALFDPKTIRRHARQFDTAVFKERLQSLIEERISAYNTTPPLNDNFVRQAQL